MRLRSIHPYTHCFVPSVPLFGRHPSRLQAVWNRARLVRCASSLDDENGILASLRGRQAVSLLPSYLADARSVVKYSSRENPDGALQLGVAESKMLEDILVPALNAPIDVASDCIYYQATAGREDGRTALCEYLEDLLGLSTNRLQLEGLIVGAGCNAVLENLCFCLAQPGDAVLIPTPYYAAFEFDLVARAGLKVEPVTTQSFHPETTCPTDARIYYPNARALDAAHERSKLAGHTPRILLVSHPQNPLGICYPPPVMAEIVEWCRSRQVHLISDEIYAGSVYRAGGFESVLKSASSTTADNQDGLGPFVHWVYALSKDFGLSGLRVGAAYSENLEIRLPMQKLNDLCQVSSSTQRWVAETLRKRDRNNELWTRAFRRENKKRLEARCHQLTTCLRDCGIPFLDPTSGLFVWIDLSEFLPRDSSLTHAEKERQLYLELVNDFGLLLTPGLSMRNERAGFFRCVFTAATDEEFSLSLARFRKFASARSSNLSK